MDTWHSIFGSAIGASPVAAISWYWANKVWKKLESSEKSLQCVASAKDAIIAQKDAEIRALQEARLDDLKAVLQLPAQRPRGFGG